MSLFETIADPDAVALAKAIDGLLKQHRLGTVIHALKMVSISALSGASGSVLQEVLTEFVGDISAAVLAMDAERTGLLSAKAGPAGAH